jgi:peptidoglycan/LPS O-acetylase OafA/YrhL
VGEIMEIILLTILVLLMALIGLLPKQNKRGNRIVASFLFLVVTSISLGVYFSNMYSLFFYGLALLSNFLGFLFSLNCRKFID